MRRLFRCVLWSVLLVAVATSPPPAAAQKSTLCSTLGQCSDGLFCNGEETCSSLQCLPGPEPCPGRACDEELDLCLPGQSPKLEGGWLDVGRTPKVVLLANTYERPVVVTTVHYAPSDPPLVVRVKQLNSDSLELYLQSPSSRRVSNRRVSYLVVEEGAWEINGHRFEAQRSLSTVTDPEGKLSGEPLSFLQAYKKPVVVGQVMSERDAGWSVFWAGAKSSRRAPAWNALRSGKTVGADPDPVREEEVLGLVVFESGHSQLGAAELEAGVTGPAVTGMNDNTPHVQLFSEAFSRTPEVALASIAGLTDPDAGWAVVVTGGTSELEAVASTQGVQLAIDEDQLGDEERSHGAERVSYLVFDRPFSYQKTPIPSNLVYPGGSEYYSCSLDQSVLDASCSNAQPAIAQDVAACEQAVENCSSLVDVGADCAACLSPIPSWKKLPVLAFLLCAPQCGGSLLDFALCRDQASAVLRTDVGLHICSACGGADCGDRYGININATGLRCDEAVAAVVKCQSETASKILSVDYLNPTNRLPGWCPFPDHWEVDVTEVLDLNDFSMKRECTPTHREGVAAVLNDANANFDCSCSGGSCGDPPSLPLVGGVACMPVNSYFKLRTTVTSPCGEPVAQKDVRVDYSSPPVTTFPIGIQARPGDQISTVIIEDSQGAPCFIEGDLDTTVPSNPPGGQYHVAQVRCRDDIGAGGCDEIQLTASVGGDGLAIRPSGVTVNLTVGNISESKAITGAIGYFDTPGLPGQQFSVSLADPVYIQTGTGLRSRCTLSPPTSSSIPQGGNSFRVADISCTVDTIVQPPEPELPPEPDPFNWDWTFGLTCDFACNSNPPGGSGGLQECDPCTYCHNPQDDTCASTCYCESVDVPGGRCYLDCLTFFILSPYLSVTTGAPPSTSGQLMADDVLKVSANASDPDGLQGFMLGVDGVYEDHVVTSGTSGSFSNLAVDTSSLSPGGHTLRVIALDNHASAPTPAFVDIPFEVDHTADPCAGDGAAPSVSITAPSSGATLNPGTIQIQVQANDGGSGVKHVRFWVDGQYQGLDSTYPYRRDWTASPGTHTIRAQAVDHCDHVRDTQITVTVVDPCAGQPGPTVSITNYHDDQWVDPDLFYFEADAQDHSGSGIDRVEFEVASFSNVAVDSMPPYVSTGWYLLSERDEVVTASAYDGCGRVASETITLHVNSNASVCEIDHNPPWAGVNTPGEGAVLPAGEVTIRADAADDGLLLAAVLEIDGVLVPNSTIIASNPAFYVWTWEATPGSHVIRIKVADVCWKIGWSLPRSVTVQ